MRLYLSTTSPYGRLAAIAAIRSGRADIKLTFVLPWQSPPELLHVNPFSQIPALIAQDGSLLTDSLIICQYLDCRFIQASRSGALLSYGMSVINQAVRYMSLANMQEKNAPPHPMMQRSKTLLEKALPSAPLLTPEAEHWGQIVLGSALNYVRMRMPDVYEKCVSRHNQEAVSRFLERDFIRQTEQAVFEKTPASIADLLRI